MHGTVLHFFLFFKENFLPLALPLAMKIVTPNTNEIIGLHTFILCSIKLVLQTMFLCSFNIQGDHGGRAPGLG